MFCKKKLCNILEFKGYRTIWINRSIYANLLRWAGRRSLGLWSQSVAIQLGKILYKISIKYFWIRNTLQNIHRILMNTKYCTKYLYNISEYENIYNIFLNTKIPIKYFWIWNTVQNSSQITWKETISRKTLDGTWVHSFEFIPIPLHCSPKIYSSAPSFQLSKLRI